MKVFLGGTCNESKWRDVLKKSLDAVSIDYFDPVVDDWNEEAQQREIRERKNCEYVLYTITPKMSGVYSIAEAVDDSNKRPDKVIFVVVGKDGNEFDEGQLKSLSQVGKMVEENGGKYLFSENEFGDELADKIARTIVWK